MMLSVVLSFYLVSGINADSAYTVTTEQGKIEGFKDAANNYVSFHGIPYAGNVSGNNRFREPLPLTNLPEGFKANNRDIVCAHPTPTGMVGQENCLTLNVFTSNLTGTKPVFLWLNGEEYSKTIDRQFSYKSLVAADTVVVAVNYRLSIFGFLCLGVEEAPGNAGLKDVIKALEWLKKNIRNFGGDPNNVILLGHGSGAAMVDLITLSPKSKGLVHKAIALSGSGLAGWAVAFDPVGYAKAFSSEVNFNVNYSNTTEWHKNLTEHLINTDLHTLANAINKFKFTDNSVLFSPCIENLASSNPFLTEAPIKVLQNGNYDQIPYIGAYVANEGTTRVHEALRDKWLEKMQKNFVDFLPADLKSSNETENAALASDIRKMYFKNNNVNNATMTYFLEYEGDTSIIIPLIRGVRERAAKKNNTYLLNFSNQDENNGSQWPYNKLSGSNHGSILDYILDGNPVADRLKQVLMNRIVSFAKTGIPGSSDDINWFPVNVQRVQYLQISWLESGELQQYLQSVIDLSFWYNLAYKSPEAIRFEDPGSNAGPVSLEDNSGLGAGYIILILVFVLALVGGAGWVVKRKWDKIKEFRPVRN